MLIIEKALNELHNNVKSMTDVVTNMVRNIDKAIQNESYDNLEYIFEQDQYLDNLEKETDQQSIELLALINPRATDLRYVFSVIKLDVDLERIGDECKNIARELQNVKTPLPDELKAMSTEVLKMIVDVFTALRNRDATLAKEVVLADDIVDTMEYEILQKYKDSLRDKVMDSIKDLK